VKTDLNELIRTGFIGIITGLAGVGVDEFRGMSAEMAALNQKMAVVVNQVTQQDKASDDHEKRIRRLELICGHCRKAGPLEVSRLDLGR
jgi:hypothetical protein